MIIFIIAFPVYWQSS